jgi:DNA-binding XRE family transcriptional regulator
MMTKYKRSDFRPAREWIDALPEERREKIYAGAAEIIKNIRLAELRKAMDVTQVKLAKKSGISQADISRIENRPETVQLRTMERYVRSLGGTFKIVAEFPDGMVAQIPLRAGKPVKSKMTAERPKLGREKGRDAA